MTDTLQSIADLLNQHIKSFQAIHETKQGGTKIQTVTADGQKIEVPFKISVSVKSRRQIR